MKQLFSFFAIVCFFLSGVGHAQVNTYPFSQTTGIYFPITGTLLDSATSTSGATSLDDVEYLSRPIGFSFLFNGIYYNNYNMTTNGLITFGSTAPGPINFTPISSATAYAGALAPFGNDIQGNFGFTANRIVGNDTLKGVSGFSGVVVGKLLSGTGIAPGTRVHTIISGSGIIVMTSAAISTGTGGTVNCCSGELRSETQGAVGNRVHIVQWKNFKRFGTGVITDNFIFQVRIYETSNAIQFIYGSFHSSGTISPVQVGLRGSTNADFNNRRTGPSPNWMFTIPGSFNTDTCSMSAAAVPFDGLTFTWLAPAAGCLTINGGFQSTLSPWINAYGSPSRVVGSGCEDTAYVTISGNRKTGSAISQTLATPIISGEVYELKFCVRLDASSLINYAKIRAVAFNGILPSSGSHPVPNSDIAIIDVTGKINNTVEWSQYTCFRWRANKNFSSIGINVENNINIFGSGPMSTADIDNICLTHVADSTSCYLAEFDSLGNILTPTGFGDLDPDTPPTEDTVIMYTGSVSDLYANCGAGNGVDTWYDDPDCEDSCESIGGEIPEDLKNFVKYDSITNYSKLAGFDSIQYMYDSLQRIQDTMEVHSVGMMDTLLRLGAITINCDSLPAIGNPNPEFANDPFQGRDIVFVHGFRLLPLKDRFDTGEDLPSWPADKSEFYDMNGYWKAGANEYWREHIVKYLGVNPDGTGSTNLHNNRFLVVSHSVTQPGIVAAFAILNQIADAMKNGTGVINSGPSRPSEKFGQNGYVIISHSAGAMFSDLAMALASRTGTNIFLNNAIGNLSGISDRCDVHISLNGAIGGSNTAPMLVLSTSLSVLPFMKDMVKSILHLDENTNPNPGDIGWMLRSQIVDMSIPYFLYRGELFAKICNLAPGPTNPFCYLADIDLLGDTPMDVITVSGGHPSEYGIGDDIYNRPAAGDERLVGYDLLCNHVLHLGFGDGVPPIASQVGGTDRRYFFPERYLPDKGVLTKAGLLAANGNPVLSKIAALLNEKLYDMAVDPKRAFRYYLDQKIDIAVCNLLWYIPIPPFHHDHPLEARLLPWDPWLYASSGVIPWLSPTGMVQPVKKAVIFNSFGLDNRGYNALNRLGMDHNLISIYKKHYSFLQSTSDHFGGSTDVTKVDDPDYYNTYFNNTTVRVKNHEESRVITDGAIYNPSTRYIFPTGTRTLKPLLSSDIIPLQKEVIKGKKKTWTFKLFGKKKTITLWFWKRKYHLLEPVDDGDMNWNNDSNLHDQLYYVYNYVLRP